MSGPKALPTARESSEAFARIASVDLVKSRGGAGPEEGAAGFAQEATGFVPPFSSPLPVDAVLPALCAELAKGKNAVLCAPPGAGKTTRVPLALLNAPWTAGKSIVMLEPRRLAAKAVARRMAASLGEQPGQRVGYRMRLESKVSSLTRILVVTEGVLTRMLQDDPALQHYACVIFDEFHERSLHADLGMAFCLDTQAALRPDLRLLAMSATLDVDAAASLLGNCSVHISQGRAWPVDIRYLPATPRLTPEQHVAAVIRHALARDSGSILVFLPGAAEIRRVEALLHGTLSQTIEVHPLYGDLPPDAQDAALMPCPPSQRKVVLSTAIAETSLTIEGVRVVVDAGLARSRVFDPSTGMGQLSTGKVSLAAARQRAGRAGRTEEGVAYRLWHEGENAGLRPFARPEILEADLAPLLLQCLFWGVQDPAALSWLDAPPISGLAAARRTLLSLDALDMHGHLTPHGRELARLPLHPRLGHMALEGARRHCAPLAACLTALLETRLPHGPDCDLEGHLAVLCEGKAGATWQRQTRAQALHIAHRLSQVVPPATKEDEKNFFAAAHAHSAQCGTLLALAWPEWTAQHIGLAGLAGQGQFRLRNGRLAHIAEESSLASRPFLAIAALDGGAARARIFLAAALPENAVHSIFAKEMEEKDTVVWDQRAEAAVARRQKRLGALVLYDAPLPDAAPALVGKAVLEGLRALGLAALPWNEDLRQWQARVACMRALEGPTWPDLSDAALADCLEDWLLPFLSGITRRSQFRHIELENALHCLLSFDLHRRLARDVPTHLDVPSGSRLRLDYCAPGGPVLAVKLQEMFGCAATPSLAAGRVPVLVHLTSPAGRPLQVTRDLASFWKDGYAAVRAEMRGRYPKHPWPENPAAAEPTRYTKARGERTRSSGVFLPPASRRE